MLTLVTLSSNHLATAGRRFISTRLIGSRHGRRCLPSLNEAQALAGERTPERCLESLWRRSHRLRCVIVKMDQAGILAKIEEGRFRQPAFPISPLDTIGAGDYFNAGVAFGLLRDWDVPRTLRFANALAAIAIPRPREVGYPTFDEVQEYAGS